MNKKIINKLVPELRFAEFKDSGEWLYSNGNDVFIQISDKNHNSDLPILAITQEHGAIPRDKIDYNVTVTEKSLESYKVVQEDDFIISLRSFQGGIEYSKYKGICSPAYIILRKYKEVDIDYFFKYFFKTQIFILELNRNLEGLRDGKMVSFKNFSEILLPKPQPKEQQKIADCLSSLDELITAQNQKLEALKFHKKGLMQQLFPAEGETVPELRFAEFMDSGDWEEKTLGILCDIITKGTTPQKFLESGIRFIKIEAFQENYINPEKCAYINNDTHNKELKRSILKENDILFAIAGATIGKINIVTKNLLPANTNQALAIVRLKKKENTNFIFSILKSQMMETYIKKSISVGAQPNLNLEQMSNFSFAYPINNNEQQKIADCLSSLDELITAQTEKIATLKTHKKGLMQGLFPNTQG